MNKPTKKQKIALIVIGIVAVLIVFADLVLVYTSLKNDGVGRGFSRYWRDGQVVSPSEEKGTSPSEEWVRNSLELVDFEVEFLDKPQLVEKDFDIFIPEDYFWNEGEKEEAMDYKFKTGVVTAGRYVNEMGEEYDLEDYEVYFLFFSKCIRLRVLHSDTRDIQFIVGHEYGHPACISPVYSFSKNVIPNKEGSQVIDLFDLSPEFNEVFDLEPFLEDSVSDLGYFYNTRFFLDGYSEYLLTYLEPIEGLVPVDSYGETVVYLIDNPEAFSFVIFSPEGFPRAVEMNYRDSLFSDSGVLKHLLESIPITLLDGETVEYKYSRWDPDTCIKDPIYSTTTEGLEVIGEAIDGSNIFIKQDWDESYLENIYENHYLAETRYVYNDIEEDDETPYTYEQFVEALPVIYWEAPFGKVLRFVRYDFITAPGDMGSCGYVT
jgi:hypothetical protein